MYSALDLGDIPARVDALRARYSLLDSRNAEVQAVRRGDFESIAPDLFSDQFRRPVVANMIDTAARDMAAMLSPLPAFNCSAPSMLSERARKFADTRTKIARHYIQSSNLELQMADRGADSYNSYGLLVACVEPDFEKKQPYIRIESSIGAYPVWNDKGKTVEFARIYYRDWFSIVADYPEVNYLKTAYPMGIQNNNLVQCVKYVSSKKCVTYLPQMGNTPLENMANPIGECYYYVAKRPNAEENGIKGAYDDVIWVQLARHRIQMLLMEGIDKAVRAPIIVGPDVDDLALGPDGIIHTQGGAQSVGRARLDMPPQAFTAGELLKSEIQVGSMSSEARSGQTDASVITGQGLQQLAASFNTQISIGQTVLKTAFRELIGMAFRMDEKLFGSSKKEIRGNDNGVPYSISYTPDRDIAGDDTVDITYGFAAGLDPNRALVFLLQADGAGLVSKDYVRRSLPVDLNAAEEEKKIAVEQSRQSLIMSFSALSQSIPQMAASGMDPTPVIQQMAMFIQLLQKGLSVEDAASKAMAPPPFPPGASTTGTPGAPPGQSAPGGGAPAGFDPNSGLPGDIRPGLATEGPQGRPDLQSLVASLGSSGQPNLQAGVRRQNPVVNG